MRQQVVAVMLKWIEEKPSDVKLHMFHFGILYMNNNSTHGNSVVRDCMVVEVLLINRRGMEKILQVVMIRTNNDLHTQSYVTTISILTIANHKLVLNLFC